MSLADDQRMSQLVIISEREIYAIARPSVVCLSSATLVHPSQPVEIFGNISMPLGTLAIH